MRKMDFPCLSSQRDVSKAMSKVSTQLGAQRILCGFKNNFSLKMIG